MMSSPASHALPCRAERAKESTLGVEMLSQRERPNEGAAGGTVYDFRFGREP